MNIPIIYRTFEILCNYKLTNDINLSRLPHGLSKYGKILTICIQLLENKVFSRQKTFPSKNTTLHNETKSERGELPVTTCKLITFFN